MEISIEINLSGMDFSPLNFNEILPQKLKGEVKKYKKCAIRRVEEKTYWLSERIVPTGVHPEEALYEFISLYAPYLDSIIKVDCKKYAQIIVKYDNTDELRGFFLNKKLISICYELGIELDIDVYADF